MVLGSGIRDLRSGIRKKPIPDPGSRGQKAPNPGSRIRIRNTAVKEIFVRVTARCCYHLLKKRRDTIHIHAYTALKGRRHERFASDLFIINQLRLSRRQLPGTFLSFWRIEVLFAVLWNRNRNRNRRNRNFLTLGTGTGTGTVTC
jgi:hypothetical protein